MSAFVWGVVGPGNIAHRFAEAVQQLPGMRLGAVHGRDPTRAAAFSARWGMPGRQAPRVAQGLDELLSDPQIDAVYVATPHSHHGDLVKAALTAGKPVLCEKPLVPSGVEAQAVVGLARSRGVFLMEALWTRFLPVYGEIAAWLRTGQIGRVQAIQSSFCFNIPFDPGTRHFDPGLAGGALLDIGVYNLAMGRWVLEHALGRCPEIETLHAASTWAPSGVDQRVAATLGYAGGVVSQFVCAFDGQADNALRIFGDAGTILVPGGFWQATEATLTRPGQASHRIEAPWRINGFEGEIEEVVRCVREGRSESERMPLSESLAIAEGLDALRAILENQPARAQRVQPGRNSPTT